MNGMHACMQKNQNYSFNQLYTNMFCFRFVQINLDMHSMFRLSCLLLSSIGLAVLYVTFKDHNKSGHFKPSPSLRPLSEQELVFLRKPKWSHFRARLKKLSFKQISRKRIRPEKADGQHCWSMDAIKVILIHVLSAAKSHHLNGKENPANMH